MISQISDLRAQNLQLQAQVSKLQEASISTSISSPQTLTQESIREIKGAIIEELQDKFRQLKA